MDLWFRIRKIKKRFDTSRAGYEYIGVNLTEEQFSDLCMINIIMNSEEGKRVPVFTLVLALKTLGLLKTEFKDDVGDSNANANLNDNRDDSFQRKFGRFLDV